MRRRSHAVCHSIRNFEKADFLLKNKIIKSADLLLHFCDYFVGAAMAYSSSSRLRHPHINVDNSRTSPPYEYETPMESSKSNTGSPSDFKTSQPTQQVFAYIEI